VKGIGIKQQLQWATVVPMVIVSLMFALFYNIELSKTLNHHSAHLGETYINQMLPIAQITLFEGDNRSLQGLVDSIATNEDILSIAFYDANGELLAYRGRHYPQKHTIPVLSPNAGKVITSKAIDKYRLRFQSPITLQHFNLYNQARLKRYLQPYKSIQADHVLGWISVDLDTKPALIKQYGLYLASICITLLGIAIGLVLHHFHGRKIYYPLQRLKHAMRQISNQAYETPIKVESDGDIGMIEKGCADLQNKYIQTVDEFYQQIDVETKDLQQSLELIESKNVNLIMDKRKAEEELKQKSILITSLSHEIRTPMNGIIGFANILLESSLSPIARDHVKTIKSSAKDLLDILNNILDYSKINAGKLKLDAIPLDIRSCIDDVLGILAPNAHKKGLDLIPSTHLDVPQTMVGDPIRIKQIISNLVSNAIKFTDNGYVLIRTQVKEVTEEHYTLCITVSDTGIGIAEDEQGKLFHPFHQAELSGTKRYAGSGLGLVICKQLAEYMGGSIRLKSVVNQGTTFSVLLKVAKLPIYEVEKTRPKLFSHIKAICFDMNPLYLEALCNGLGHLGMHCIQANGINPLQSAFIQHPDAKLAFIHIVQEHEETITSLIQAQKIPTVLISKWPIEHYQSLGARAFILQPPNIQKLRNTVESLLLQAASFEDDTLALDALRDEVAKLNPNLLIAEDNEVNQMLLRAWLADIARLDVVDDGEQALALCHQKKFDTILIDLHMPKLDGLSAMHFIREQTLLNKQTPALLISADNHDLDRAFLDEHKIVRKLPKPIDEKTLLEHLITVLKQAKTSPIDWSLCVKKMSGNRAFAYEFLERFVSELTLQRETLIHGDIKQIEETAHSLRGACGFSGLPFLETALANLEYLSAQSTHIEEIKAALEDTMKEIENLIEAFNHLTIEPVEG